MIRMFLALGLVAAAATAVAAGPAILTLPAAQGEAREHAPERATADAKVAGSTGRAEVAGRWLTHDPIASASYSAGNDRAWSAGLEWTIDVGGAWRARGAAASADVVAAKSSRDATFAGLDASVAVAFAELADAQRRLGRSERLVALHELAAEVAERTRTAGSGTQLEVDATALDLRAARIDRAAVRGELNASRVRLSRLLGRTKADDLVVADDIVIGTLPSVADLQGRVSRDPRVRAAAAEVDAARQTAIAERRAARPSVTFGVDVGRTSNDIPVGAFTTDPNLRASWTEWDFGFRLSVPLPVFDRRLEARADARSRVLEAEASLGVVRADVRAEVASVHAQLVAAAEAVQGATDVPAIVERQIQLLDKALRSGAIDFAAWSQQARRLEEVDRSFDEAVLALRRARAAWARIEPT